MKGGGRGKANTLSKGKWGEELACDFLLRREFKIIERNFFARVGEIDIIAKKNNICYFVEVKTRFFNSFGSFESVTRLKTLRLRLAAKAWLAQISAKKHGKFAAYEFITLVVAVNKQLKKVSFYWFNGWNE